MSTAIVSDQELTQLLVAVGADHDVSIGHFDNSLEDLGLDSLARAELATKIRAKYRTELGEEIQPEATPNDVRRIVMTKLSATSGA